MKALVNYTTTISTERTVMEIEKILAQFGASHIYKMYDNAECSAIAFKYPFQNDSLSFTLPMNAEAIHKILKRRNIPKKLQSIEQARRVGWRIIRQWIQAQIALIDINAVSFEQVFLGYIYDEKRNITFYDKVIENKLLLD